MAANGRTRADTRLIAELAAGRPVAEAAAASGVSERTAFRRLNNPAFRRAVDEARAAMLADATGRLAKLTAAAADALSDLLKPETAATARLGAAKAVIDSALKTAEAVDIERRLAALEERQGYDGETAYSENGRRRRP